MPFQPLHNAGCIFHEIVLDYRKVPSHFDTTDVVVHGRHRAVKHKGLQYPRTNTNSGTYTQTHTSLTPPRVLLPDSILCFFIVRGDL